MNLGYLKMMPKSWLIIGAASILVAVVFLSVIFINLISEKAPPAPPPTPPAFPYLPSTKGAPVVIENISPQSQTAFKGYSGVELGKTTDAEISRFPDIAKKEEMPDRKVVYEFESADPLRNNKIITEDGVAAYKSSVSITAQDYKTPKFSVYREAYGDAEAEYEGSVRYGRYIKTYFYGSKGFALIVNPLTDEVFEVQSFMPTSSEDYLAKWGQDAREYRETPETGEY